MILKERKYSEHKLFDLSEATILGWFAKPGGGGGDGDGDGDGDTEKQIVLGVNSCVEENTKFLFKKRKNPF